MVMTIKLEMVTTVIRVAMTTKPLMVPEVRIEAVGLKSILQMQAITAATGIQEIMVTMATGFSAVVVAMATEIMVTTEYAKFI